MPMDSDGDGVMDGRGEVRRNRDLQPMAARGDGDAFADVRFIGDAAIVREAPAMPDGIGISGGGGSASGGTGAMASFVPMSENAVWLNGDEPLPSPMNGGPTRLEIHGTIPFRPPLPATASPPSALTSAPTGEMTGMQLLGLQPLAAHSTHPAHSHSAYEPEVPHVLEAQAFAQFPESARHAATRHDAEWDAAERRSLADHPGPRVTIRSDGDWSVSIGRLNFDDSRPSLNPSLNLRLDPPGPPSPPFSTTIGIKPPDSRGLSAPPLTAECLDCLEGKPCSGCADDHSTPPSTALHVGGDDELTSYYLLRQAFYSVGLYNWGNAVDQKLAMFLGTSVVNSRAFMLRRDEVNHRILTILHKALERPLSYSEMRFLCNQPEEELRGILIALVGMWNMRNKAGQVNAEQLNIIMKNIEEIRKCLTDASSIFYNEDRFIESVLRRASSATDFTELEFQRLCNLPKSKLNYLISRLERLCLELRRLLQRFGASGLHELGVPPEAIHTCFAILQYLQKCTNSGYNPRNPTTFIPPEIPISRQIPLSQYVRGKYQRRRVSLFHHCEFAKAQIRQKINEVGNEESRQLLSNHLRELERLCPSDMPKFAPVSNDDERYLEELKNFYDKLRDDESQHLSRLTIGDRNKLRDILAEYPLRDHVCGPDVTRAVQNAIRATIQGWISASKNLKESMAKELINWFDPFWKKVSDKLGEFLGPGPDNLSGGGAEAWDIVDLFTVNAIPGRSFLEDWRPFCALSEDCYSTVWFNGRCFYSGSVNYIIFGVMFRLIENARRKGEIELGDSFSEIKMLEWIDIWKGLYVKSLRQILDHPAGRIYDYICARVPLKQDKPRFAGSENHIVYHEAGHGMRVRSLHYPLTQEEVQRCECVLVDTVIYPYGNLYTSMNFSVIGYNLVDDENAILHLPPIDEVESEFGNKYAKCMKCEWNGGEVTHGFEVRWLPHDPNFFGNPIND